MSKKKRRKPGRPSFYETRVKPRIKDIPKLRRQGYRVADLAQLFNVSLASFNRYMANNEELAKAMERGKEELILDLEDSLYRRALGLVIDEQVKTIKNIRSDGEVVIREEKTVRQLPPHATSLIFALKNLKPESWNDRYENREEEQNENKEIIESISILVDNIRKEKNT